MAKKALLLMLALVFAGGWSQPMFYFACPFAGQTEICRDAAQGGYGASLSSRTESGHNTHASSPSASQHSAHDSHQPAAGLDQAGVPGMDGPADTVADVAASVKYCDMQTCGQLYPPPAGAQFTLVASLPGLDQSTQYRYVWSFSLYPSGIFHPPSSSLL
ncbi:MAG: hypothetical protein LBN33_04985 [Desulfovibrio sp.]|nr:hypothetical protein [Desulfovibrio sp.]